MVEELVSCLYLTCLEATITESFNLLVSLTEYWPGSLHVILHLKLPPTIKVISRMLCNRTLPQNTSWGLSQVLILMHQPTSLSQRKNRTDSQEYPSRDLQRKVGIGGNCATVRISTVTFYFFYKTTHTLFIGNCTTLEEYLIGTRLKFHKQVFLVFLS